MACVHACVISDVPVICEVHEFIGEVLHCRGVPGEKNNNRREKNVNSF